MMGRQRKRSMFLETVDFAGGLNVLAVHSLTWPAKKDIRQSGRPGIGLDPNSHSKPICRK
jgi:hypothetical protein